jgi:small subunit ribosomal protein S1
LARGSGPLAARGLGVAKPASPAAGKIGSQGGKERGGKGSGTGPKQRGGGAKPSSPAAGKAFRTSGVKVPGEAPVDDRANSPGETDPASAAAPQSADADEPKASAPSNAPPAGTTRRVEVPNLRQPLGDDLLAEWEAELSSADVDAMLKEPAGLQKRPASIEEGEKVRGTVLKTDEEAVYVSLGGPDEGAVPRDQFDELPTAGQSLELVVRGFNREDGLYQLVVPGQAMDVSDWDDLDEGAVVEAHVTAANTGGLEATVGSIRGFIPISQIAIYRVEDTAEFVGQRMVCLVTECNPRRKNLVLSRRAILEREREEQRQQQLEQIEPGDSLEGTVSSLKDFGAFVDLGGLDGLIHISRLSWDNVKHPGEVLEVGQKVKVKVEKIDKQTGKIALSYRDLLENPWDSIEATCPVGSVVTGTVTRLANFGAFVKISAGIEGLVHISEIASHRVSNVNSVLKEGEQVQVKVLSVERESQRIALSVKQAQSKAASGETKTEEPADEPPREPAVRRQHAGPLKGGVGGGGDDNPFGLKLG